MSIKPDGWRSPSASLYLVYGLVVFYALCYQLQAPLEPFLVERLVGKDNASEASVSYGRLQSLFSGIQMFASLLFGHILDKAGVRVGFILNFMACAATYFLLSITDSMAMLYASKIPGIGMAGFLCAQTAVSELTAAGPERVQALGRLTTAYTLGGIVGPYCGGLLGAKGDYFLSAKLAMLGSILAAAGCILLPSSAKRTADKSEEDREAKTNASERLSWVSRICIVLRAAGFLSMVKLITSTSNSMASATQSLVLKNELKFAEADLGFFMSAQFAFGAFSNAVLLGPVTELLGGAPRFVVRNCIVGMAIGYCFQAFLNSDVAGISYLMQPIVRQCSFVAMALLLSIFQYSLATSITAENTQLVPEDMKGTLIGMEHCIFSAARVVTPAMGINILNEYGMGGLYASCASIFIATYILWVVAQETQEPQMADEAAFEGEDNKRPHWDAPSRCGACAGDLQVPLSLLSRAYAGTGFGDDAADWEGYLAVENANGFTNSALYGEVNEQDFAELLRDHLLPPARVYDLGSGTGKLVNLAAVLGFRATGVELEPGRHHRACSAAKAMLRVQADVALEGLQPVQPRFLLASFLDFDFSDADLVWANSVVFSPAMMEAVAAQARKMRPGAYVVSHKLLPGPGFEPCGDAFLRVSWRPEGRVCFKVQKVLGEPS
ncbi:Slc22a18 [Symbiodinium sp. CCMP2592]|nr:Slc22a18 [Symbiodinium sp. CCMP2592]